MFVADKDNVRELSDRELCGLLVIDQPKGHIYRPEAAKRLAFAAAIEAAQKRLYGPPPRNGVDIRPLMDAALLKEVVSLEELCRAIKDSSWDRKDPKGLMRKSPQEVDDFLMDMIIKKLWFRDLESTEQKNLMKMICDAYNRWRDQG
jgi:hypothetical protein